MRRIVFALVVVSALGLVLVGRGLAQDETADLGDHPLVGSWLVTFPDSPDTPPSLYTFAADGTVIGSSAAGPRHGAWRSAADDQTAEFTVFGVSADPFRGPLAAVVEIRGRAVVDESGNTITITYVVGPVDTSTTRFPMDGPYQATGTRIEVQPMPTLEATPAPGEVTPAAGTPVASPASI